MHTIQLLQFRPLLISAFVFGFTIFTFQLSAGDSSVPGDFATVQAAIDDAGTVAGDTITITVPGHSETNINITKAITIAGAAGASLDDVVATSTFVTAPMPKASVTTNVAKPRDTLIHLPP